MAPHPLEINALNLYLRLKVFYSGHHLDNGTFKYLTTNILLIKLFYYWKGMFLDPYCISFIVVSIEFSPL